MKTFETGDPARIGFVLRFDGEPFGTMDLWLGGTRLGDSQETMVMAVPARALSNCLRLAERPSAPERADEIGVPAFLDEVYRSNFGPLDDDSDDGHWSETLLCPGMGEAFDECLVFACSSSDYAHLFWKDLLTGETGRITVPLSEWTDVASQTVSIINAESKYP